MNPNSEQIQNFMTSIINQKDRFKDVIDDIDKDKDTIMKVLTDDMKNQLNSDDLEGLFISMLPHMKLMFETIPGLKKASEHIENDIAKSADHMQTFIRDGKRREDYIEVKSIYHFLLVDQERYKTTGLWLAAVAHEHPEWDPVLADEYVDKIIDLDQSPITALKLNCFWSLFLATGDTRWSDRVKEFTECSGKVREASAELIPPSIFCSAYSSYSRMCDQFPDILSPLNKLVPVRFSPPEESPIIM